MRNKDVRNLPKEVQQHNRDQAIRLFKKGKSRKEIAVIIEVHYDVVCRWIRAWKKDDAEIYWATKLESEMIASIVEVMHQEGIVDPA